MSPVMFTPLEIGPVTAPNRIAIGPMCQYTADDGCAADWHLQAVMNYAMSGAGTVILEATGVTREGRITHGCLGLYSDACEYALERVLHAARKVALPGVRFGIQLGHAGRKASVHRPWQGGGRLHASESPWQTISASALPFTDGWHVPQAVSEAQIEAVIAAFAAAAQRAERLGFDMIELHGAHGYLIHQFQSPLSNMRTDKWGGDAAGRLRFPLAVADAVRAAVSSRVALGARITGADLMPGGLEAEDGAEFARGLRQRGYNYVCVSAGNVVAGGRPPPGNAFNVPNAAHIRRGSGMVVRTGGLISEPMQAEAILASGDVDQIVIARPQIDDPRWGWHAAEKLGVKLRLPPQYERAAPDVWRGAALVRPRA